MFESPIDAWYVWLGVTLASTGALAAAVSLPTAPPPDAVGAARVVDGVAGSRYAAMGEHPLVRTEELRLTPTSIGLRGQHGAAHATLRAGPVTPATTTELQRVLAGAPPAHVFARPSALQRAARSARRDHDPEWRTAPATLRVRHVTWGGVDVTLVG